MTPLSVLETVLYADDLAAVIPFYHDVLGFELFSHEEGRHVFFRAGPSMLLVFNPASTSSDEVSVNGARIPTHGATGPGHVAFAVTSAALEDWKTELAEAGIPVESEIDWPGGGRSVYVRDPAGNSVELATRDLWFDT